jgi:hypothetical protein
MCVSFAILFLWRVLLFVHEYAVNFHAQSFNAEPIW